MQNRAKAPKGTFFWRLYSGKPIRSGELKQIWDYHIDLGERIHLATMELNELTRQMWLKKCFLPKTKTREDDGHIFAKMYAERFVVRRSSRYRLNNHWADSGIYGELFLGRRDRRWRDVFPSEFQDRLSSILFVLYTYSRKDAPMNHEDVYHNAEVRLTKIVRKTRYDLSDEPTMTEDDKWIVVRALERLRDLMTECINTCRRFSPLPNGENVDYDNVLVQERDRLHDRLHEIALSGTSYTQLRADKRDMLWEWRRVAAEAIHHPSRKRSRNEFELE